MAYFATNPPVLLLQLHPAGKRLWFYNSVDAAAAVRVSGYFTNGVALGMRDKDLIWVQVSATGLSTMHIVLVSVAGVVDLTDATAITTATNTD